MDWSHKIQTQVSEFRSQIPRLGHWINRQIHRRTLGWLEHDLQVVFACSASFTVSLSILLRCCGRDISERR